MKRRETLNHQSGIALATVVLVLAIVAIITSGMVLIAITQTSTIKNNVRAVDAFVYAEAGIEWAQAHLLDKRSFASDPYNPAYTGTKYTVPFQSGETETATTGTVTVAVWIYNNMMTASVTSRAEIAGYGVDFPEAKRAIEASFNLSGGYSNYAMKADEQIVFSGENTNIEINNVGGSGPSVLSNFDQGDSVIFNGNKLTGNPDPVIGYVEGGGVDFDGLSHDPDATAVKTATDWVELMPFDILNAQAMAGIITLTSTTWLKNTTHTGPCYVNGDLNLSGNNIVINGLVYVEGRIFISGPKTGISGTMNLVANGEIRFDKNANTTFSGNVGLITKSTFILDQSASLGIDVGLIWAGDDITVGTSGRVDISGSIVSKGSIDFDINSYLTLTWKDITNTGNLPGLGRDSATMRLWKEVPPTQAP